MIHKVTNMMNFLSYKKKKIPVRNIAKLSKTTVFSAFLKKRYILTYFCFYHSDPTNGSYLPICGHVFIF